MYQVSTKISRDCQPSSMKHFSFFLLFWKKGQWLAYNIVEYSFKIVEYFNEHFLHNWQNKEITIYINIIIITIHNVVP